MTDAAKKPRADWEAIESLYRAGVLSIREIGKQHGISDPAIRKKAQQLGWQRDLGQKVRDKVRSELVRTEVRTADPISDEQVVEQEARKVVSVIRGHRGSITRMATIAGDLLDELAHQTIERELYEQLGFMLRKENDKGIDRANDLYLKLISGAGRIDSMKKLAETMKILIGLERQAFNISDEAERPQDGLAALLDMVQAKGSRLPIKHEPVTEE